MSMDTPDKKEPAETKTVEVSAIQFEENRRMLEETLRVPMDQRADVVEEVNQMEHKATVRYRMGRDELTAALREALVSMADKHARKEYGDAVAEVSAKWSNETTIEGLAAKKHVEDCRGVFSPFPVALGHGKFVKIGKQCAFDHVYAPDCLQFKPGRPRGQGWMSL